MTRSGWRSLFADDTLPTPDGWPPWLDGLAQAFAQLKDADDAAACKAWQPTLVRALQALDVPAWRISQVISDHNDWLYRLTIRQALDEMAQQGWGTPPCDFCVLTLGSGARHESLLGPDQDNAMIIDDYPLHRHVEIDTWFQSLAERFTDRLDQAGIPLCNGDVMARWPLWRKPLEAWCEQMRLWTGQRTVRRVQLSNILLDFSPVYGNAALAERFAAHVRTLVPNAGLFLDEMTALQDETRVALDRFDRLASDGQDAPHRHALNLKRQGLLPLQAALRLLALRHGISAMDCRGRLAALKADGIVDDELVEGLEMALSLLLEHVLNAQMQAVEQGRKPDGWIDRRTLSRQGEQQLRQALRHIRRAQGVASR